MPGIRFGLVVVIVAAFGFAPSANAQEWVAGVGAVCEPAQIGRLGLLRNVHAYDQNGTAVAPIRCIAELLGAQVDYKAPSVVVESSQPPVTIEIVPGSRVARVNGRDEDMGATAVSYGGIACAPVRFLSECLGAKVEYADTGDEADFAFGPVLTILLNKPPNQYVLVLHDQPPPVVAKFVADLQYSTQSDASGVERQLGSYGMDWIAVVGELASDGSHFISGTPCVWTEDSPLAPVAPSSVEGHYIRGTGWIPDEVHDPKPGFYGNAGAIYGIRDGRWRLLISSQDVFPFGPCERAGIPRRIVRELIPEPLYTAEEWENTGDQTPNDWADRTGEPETTYFLTLENARVLAHVGGGYYVMGLNFTRASDYLDRGVRVLGQVITPAFEDTGKPVRIEMTLTAFDEELRVIGSSSLNFNSVPSGGATLPFETRLFDVRLEDLAFVGIAPKGAWVPRD